MSTLEKQIEARRKEAHDKGLMRMVKDILHNFDGNQIEKLIEDDLIFQGWIPAPRQSRKDDMFIKDDYHPGARITFKQKEVFIMP